MSIVVQGSISHGLELSLSRCQVGSNICSVYFMLTKRVYFWPADLFLSPKHMFATPTLCLLCSKIMIPCAQSGHGQICMPSDVRQPFQDTFLGSCRLAKQL